MSVLLFRKSLLACSVSALSLASPSVLSNDLFNTGNSFIDDASLSGKLRTVYYNIKNTEKSSKDNRDLTGAWTGAVWLDLKSGYLNDFFAIGASAYGVAKIDTLRDVGSNRSNQLLLDDNKGYTQVKQLWADLKYGDKEQGFNGHVKLGRQIIYNGLISSSGSRSAPTTWQGVNFEAEYFGTEIGLAWVNQISLRNTDEFKDLTNFNDKKIDYIWGAEVARKFQLPNDQSIKVKYRNAFSKDYLQAHNVGVKWTMPLVEEMKLSLGGKVYYTKKNGDLWNKTAWYAPAFDDNATVGSLFAELSSEDWTLEAAVTKTKAESSLLNYKNGYTAPGKYYYDFGKNTHGIWDIPTSAFAEDFYYDNELAWMLGVTLDMTKTGLPGLTLGYAYTHGSDFDVKDKQGNKSSVTEHEHDFLVQYKFPEPLKGLKFKLKYGMYRNDEKLRKAIGKEENDLRVWLDYKFVLF
ncbi:hypothetical protein EOPP23_00190 [Endozoicomonas sp. OPT23]|uniref:OprD family outer membrane porin n=1 Tax=Endozoicomonas sp. OPT23 TaxID=2072845 RepID=UPI00129B158E|nr:OprD family outer membrane porin [Endozoicomonas sp. OPT23]MRI31407.1 hypothetical protein [Endozoicomonas sp. OPT23]